MPHATTPQPSPVAPATEVPLRVDPTTTPALSDEDEAVQDPFESALSRVDLLASAYSNDIGCTVLLGTGNFSTPDPFEGKRQRLLACMESMSEMLASTLSALTEAGACLQTERPDDVDIPVLTVSTTISCPRRPSS